MKTFFIGWIAAIVFLAANAGSCMARQLEKATFSGGCFWRMECIFRKLHQAYREGTGRNLCLAKVWGAAAGKKSPYKKDTPYEKFSEKDLKQKLTPLQCDVTQKNATEKPFNNSYWNDHREGIYVDIVSGEPLFSSADKFDSKTGWPSFTKPLEPANIVEKEDRSMPMERTEVRSKHADSHLGHVFKDGPKPTGLRFCINSAALRFIPKENLEKEGYGEYKNLLSENNPNE